MRLLKDLFERNREWAESIKRERPGFFSDLTHQQNPRYLWIGCSDSRVPANQIVGLLPGELFVHRNVANQVVHTDLNCLAVLQFAVDVIKVEHVIVCGHYGCGGVEAALQDNRRLGLVDNWLRHIEDIAMKHDAALSKLSAGTERFNRLSELNVIEQVANVCRTTIVQDAWARGQSLAVHGWIYAIDDGLLRDLNVTFSSPEEFESTTVTWRG